MDFWDKVTVTVTALTLIALAILVGVLIGTELPR